MSVIIKKSNSNNVVAFDKTKLESAFDEYQNQGFHILPLDDDNICHKSKEQQEAYTNPIPKDFEGKGVGIHLEKSNLVGIDVDCDEVVPFLETFLPQTATTCRKSKATSWKFFKLDGGIDKNIRFPNCDNEGKATQELGGVKFKAVTPLPPTIHHKSKESIEWKFNELATITAKELIETAARGFGMALIALRWPEVGNRHEAGLALSGSLAHAGWSIEDAEKAIKALAKSVGDNKVEDRLKELQSSYEAYNASQKATGLPSLISHLTTSSKEQKYLKKTLYAWLRGNPYPDKETKISHPKSSSEYCLSIPELKALKPPLVSYIVHNWLPSNSVVNLFALEGIGKTWFCYELAICVAKGKNFFEWPITKPHKVLLVDGEMTSPEILERMSALIGDENLENLTLFPVDLMLADDEEPNIYDEEWQEWFNEGLREFEEQGKKFDLIIFDNLSSLGYGIDENSNSDIQIFLRWARKLKAKGYAVLFVTHAGKNGENRGASAKGGAVHTIVKLTTNEKSSEIASFTVTFPKHRGLRHQPSNLAVKLTPNEEGRSYWHNDSTETMPAYLKIAMAIHKHNPKTQADIVKETGFVKSHVSTQVKILAEKEFLTKESLTLTPKGKEEIAPYLQEESDIESNL